MCVYFLISLPPPSSNNCFALSTHTVRRPQTQDAQEAFFGFGAKQVHHTWPSTLGFLLFLAVAGCLLKEPNEQDRKGLCSDSPSSTYKHVLQFFMSIFRASVIAAESTNGLVYVYSYLAHAIATKDLACPSKQ